ncbi:MULTISPECIES: FadR/GntR family transcriptional regulator [Arthrobacter]|uniref:FadR family transcriptional regulator n=1 Tax=Arthrobacter terricola TaxID=2547396 RepID=A0A4R5KFA8_9MICC|nr:MULTISPECIES: FCD domain-containing protein [Arthrobacter]MBT8162143.1 FCD domain-containing protein [Arthrobacter sp. GN70]TDF93956.1 FadR family transcriptional regulator [Arthrobacter terricola]
MRTHELVLAWIEKQLSDGHLVLGGRLPAERALAEKLEVSRTSVREAIRILEAMGVVRAGVGSGKDAGTIVIAEPGTALGSALRLHVATQHLPVADIVQTRILLESWAVSRARADAPELLEAGRLLDRMDASTAVDDFLALDVAFHLALAEAAGNAVVSTIMGSLREAIEGYAAALTLNLPDWDSTADRLRREHRAILAAVNHHDGGRAAELVAAHIEGYYREAGLGQDPAETTA